MHWNKQDHFPCFQYEIPVAVIFFSVNFWMWDESIGETWESALMEMSESLSVCISKTKIRLMKLITWPYVCKVNKSESKPKFGWIFQGNSILDIHWSSMLNLKFFPQNRCKRNKRKKFKFILGGKLGQGLGAAYSHWALSLATVASPLLKYFELIELEAEAPCWALKPKSLKWGE